MLKITQSIKNLDDSDIADNIFHYSYNTNHLESLLKQGIDVEDPAYMSSYRSFEGEVFENFIYEKLLRYAQNCDEVDKFILKGFHQDKHKAFANTLSISERKNRLFTEQKVERLVSLML